MPFRPRLALGLAAAAGVAAASPSALAQSVLFITPDKPEVPAGGSIKLVLVVPPLKTPGGYLLRADLVDATAAGVPVRTAGFYKFGCDPLLVNFRVR